MAISFKIRCFVQIQIIGPCSVLGASSITGEQDAICLEIIVIGNISVAAFSVNIRRQIMHFQV